jgi:hypothetical protein
MSTLTDIGSFLSGASQQAAAWYNGVNMGTPVIPIGASSAAIAAQQAAINQAAQANLLATNPTLAGIISNPTIIIIIGLVLVLGIILVLRM